MGKRVREKPKTFYRWLKEDIGVKITPAEANRLWTIWQKSIPSEIRARGLGLGKLGG